MSTTPNQNSNHETPRAGRVAPLPDVVTSFRPDWTKTPASTKALPHARVLSMRDIRDLNDRWAPSQRHEVSFDNDTALSYIATADPRMSRENPAVNVVDQETARYLRTILEEFGVDVRRALDVAFGEEA